MGVTLDDEGDGPGRLRAQHRIVDREHVRVECPGQLGDRWRLLRLGSLRFPGAGLVVGGERRSPVLPSPVYRFDGQGGTGSDHAQAHNGGNGGNGEHAPPDRRTSRLATHNATWLVGLVVGHAEMLARRLHPGAARDAPAPSPTACGEVPAGLPASPRCRQGGVVRDAEERAIIARYPAGMDSKRLSRWFPFTPRQTAGLVLVVLAVIFVLENRRSTTIRFLIPEVTAPLWVALFASLVVGLVAGGLLVHGRQHE
jgi:hypothetical protein